MEDNVDPNSITRKIKEEAEACVNEMYSVSISVGYCVAKENDGMCLEDFEKIADKRMYQDKTNYYMSKGINRRARDEVFSGIYDLYTKILKVNLKSGDVDVIKMDIREEDEAYGYSGDIKSWLYNFAHCGMVHEEDVEMFLEKTNPTILRRQFLVDKNKIVRMCYRRRAGDTYHKVMMEIIPKKEYCEEEQIVFIYVKDMEMI